MKKLLIICENKAMQISLSLTCEEEFKQIITTGHEDALMMFICEAPTHVIILECDKYLPGNQTLSDIKNSATDQKIIRCGYSNLDSEDYLQVPFLIDDLFKKIQ